MRGHLTSHGFKVSSSTGLFIQSLFKAERWSTDQENELGRWRSNFSTVATLHDEKRGGLHAPERLLKGEASDRFRSPVIQDSSGCKQNGKFACHEWLATLL